VVVTSGYGASCFTYFLRRFLGEALGGGVIAGSSTFLRFGGCLEPDGMSDLSSEESLTYSSSSPLGRYFLFLFSYMPEAC